MVLELYVLGPAFSLPSLDPPCLAAIAYFTQVVPRGEWVLLAAVDGGEGELGELPAVRDGPTLVGGFDNIVAYLGERSNGQWHLDAALTPLQKADCAAFSSHLHHHTRPLLDLSLYVSRQNWISATRPAFSAILSFPDTWTYPHARRTTAKARASHLGLASLDIDPDSISDPNLRNTFGLTPSRPTETSRPTISSTIKDGHADTIFRLSSLASSALAPLSDLLATTAKTSTNPPPHPKAPTTPFLLTPHRPTTLDCLAVAHLALCFLPALPHPFLASALKSTYPQLVAYTTSGIKHFYGGPAQPDDAFPGIPLTRGDDDDGAFSGYENLDIGSGAVILPWRDPIRPDVLARAGAVARLVPLPAWAWSSGGERRAGVVTPRPSGWLRQEHPALFWAGWVGSVGVAALSAAWVARAVGVGAGVLPLPVWMVGKGFGRGREGGWSRSMAQREEEVEGGGVGVGVET